MEVVDHGRLEEKITDGLEDYRSVSIIRMDLVLFTVYIRLLCRMNRAGGQNGIAKFSTQQCFNSLGDWLAQDSFQLVTPMGIWGAWANTHVARKP